MVLGYRFPHRLHIPLAGVSRGGALLWVALFFMATLYYAFLICASTENKTNAFITKVITFLKNFSFFVFIFLYFWKRIKCVSVLNAFISVNNAMNSRI